MSAPDKQTTDAWLRGRLAPAEIADEGFSAAVVRRTRRETLLFRTLPVAAGIAGAVVSMALMRSLPPTDWAAIGAVIGQNGVIGWLQANGIVLYGAVAATLGTLMIGIVEG